MDKDLSSPITQHQPVIQLGAGSWYIDRYAENGGVRGAEIFVGDAVAGELSATVERTRVFSGSGAVATKLLDKVTQVDRTLGITPQDSSLDNIALFLIASAPATMGEQASADLVTVFNAPANLTDRMYFQLGASAADPAGRPRFKLKANPLVLADGIKSRAIGADGNYAALAVTDADFEIDLKTGRIRFTASGVAKVKNKELQVTIKAAKNDAAPAFDRVSVNSGAAQVRVAARYVEDPDEGIPGRNLYIPQASVSPSGAAALMSRDTPQRWPITLAVEDPGNGLAEIYIDGVPA